MDLGLLWLGECKYSKISQKQKKTVFNSFYIKLINYTIGLLVIQRLYQFYQKVIRIIFLAMYIVIIFNNRFFR